MAATKPPSSPFDDVRSAFDGLATSKKAAFVLEAAFTTLGQALEETGRRVSQTLDDLNVEDWFRPMGPEPRTKTSTEHAAPPPPPPVPPPPAGKTRPSAPPPSEPDL